MLPSFLESNQLEQQKELFFKIDHKLRFIHLNFEHRIDYVEAEILFLQQNNFFRQQKTVAWNNFAIVE